MHEDIVFIFKHRIEIILFMFLLFIGIHFNNKNQLDDLTKVYAEITATTGGFTTYQYNDLIRDLKEIGFSEEDTLITIKATAPDGTDLTNKVINVTPPSETYVGEPVYCPRGSKISLTVTSKKKAAINNIFKIVNSNSNISYGTSKRVYMSERVE